MAGRYHAEWTSDKKYKQAEELAEFNRKQKVLDDESYNKTETGRAKLAKTRSETAENTANATKLRTDAGAASTQQTDSVMGLDGKTVKLTTAEANGMNKAADKLAESIPSITPEDAYRVDKGLSTDLYRTFVDKAASAVDKDPKKRNEAIKSIAKRFRVKNDTAAGVLDQALKYVDKEDKPGLWERWFSGGNSSDDSGEAVDYSSMN